MNKAVADDYEEVVNNSDDLGKEVQSISNVAVEEQEPVSGVEGGSDLGFATLEEQESVSNLKKISADFSIPLSIFHYKDYNSDFFTSWYNISSEVFKEINRACPEKKVLNLALSVLMFPYIVFTALGLAVYNKLKTNDKTQISSEENKTKKSKVSESTAKRLAYGVLAPIAVLVSIPILLLLLIPATPALAIFYLLNRKLSHSLIDVLKVSSGLYKNEHQNIEVSFRETEVIETDIKWDMEIKFPPQFKQLLRDLYQSENGKWVDVTRDSEHNIILKLLTKIDLKNGLKSLRNEINNVLATSIQEFAKAMEELMKLEKKDITYDKLKELLNEFRLKVISSIDSKLITHLIGNAYQVAFIQAIKFAQKRKEDFSLEGALRDILMKQELESQGKELPSVYHEETTEALRKAEETIKELKKMGEDRYGKIHEELEEIYENRKDSNLKDDALKRRLEYLFKFEYNDQEVERRLIKSVMKKAQGELSRLGILEKQGLERFKQRMHAIWNLLFDKDKEQSLMTRLKDLEKNEKTSDKINDFIEEAYLEIKKYKVQRLLKEQKEGVLDLCGTLKRYDESDLAEIIEAFRKQDQRHLEESTLEQTLKDQNERLQAKQNDREKGHPITKSIEVLLKRLELEQKELLINEEAKNNYKEELESREKIKFAIIEDKLLEVLKQEAFNEAKIKELLEKAELEYCLAEKRMKGPVIEIKNNIKHFCQSLLSPLRDRLVKSIINNAPKDNESGF